MGDAPWYVALGLRAPAHWRPEEAWYPSGRRAAAYDGQVTGSSTDALFPAPPEHPAQRPLEAQLLRARVPAPPLLSLTGSSPPVAGMVGVGGRPTAADALDEASLADRHEALMTAARARLGRTADRIEAVLREAAASGLPASAVPGRVRHLGVRGVTRGTLAELADELERLLKP